LPLRAARHFICLLLLTLLALTALPARADYDPGVTWLERVHELHVRADATYVQTTQFLLRIDTEAAVEENAERRIRYSSSLETLDVLEAWTITPDRRRVVVAPDRIRRMESTDEGQAEFSDQKVRVVIFPAVTAGARLHLRFRITVHTTHFPGHMTWSLHYPPGVRYDDARVHISHDPAIALKVGTRQLAGGRVAALDTDAPDTVRYAFTFRQPVAHPPETGRVDPADFAPFVHVTSFADRAAQAAAYQAAVRPKAEPTPQIRALAAELTAGAATDREKVRRLHQWVSRNIRYVALNIDVSGLVPRPAQAVLDHRYGDCKDHVVLLEALLRAAGIESSPALVNAGMAMKLPELAIWTPFNHVILHVTGLDLYLDSTARFAPMGKLPDWVMDKPVLLTASGRLARTPRTTPKANQTLTRVWMDLAPEGGVRGRSVAVMQGPEEVDSRSAQYDHIGTPPQDTVRDILGRFGETGTGRVESGDPLDLGSAWEVRASFQLDPVVNVPGPSAMTIPVGVAPGLVRGMATSSQPTQRRFDRYCLSWQHREEIELRLPPQVRITRIPAGTRFQRGPLRYSATYRRTGQVVSITRELAADRPSHTCNSSDDADWAALLRVLQRDLRGQIFLR
jgi:predicted transglutaminase-like cysteine proteinase